MFNNLGWAAETLITQFISNALPHADYCSPALVEVVDNETLNLRDVELSPTLGDTFLEKANKRVNTNACLIHPGPSQVCSPKPG